LRTFSCGSPLIWTLNRGVDEGDEEAFGSRRCPSHAGVRVTRTRKRASQSAAQEEQAASRIQACRQSIGSAVRPSHPTTARTGPVTATAAAAMPFKWDRQDDGPAIGAGRCSERCTPCTPWPRRAPRPCQAPRIVARSSLPLRSAGALPTGSHWRCHCSTNSAVAPCPQGVTGVATAASAAGPQTARRRRRRLAQLEAWQRSPEARGGGVKDGGGSRRRRGVCRLHPIHPLHPLSIPSIPSVPSGIGQDTRARGSARRRGARTSV
jgi:hypothetical protein